MEKIEFFIHNLNKKDILQASKVMRSVFLTTGPVVARFEKEFAEYLKVPYVVGLTSCTAAIHLALLKNGIGPGDEVITTPMTFVATITAIMQAGARPVFVDVCPKSALLLPENVEPFITKRTKALLPVHLYGRMADMAGFSLLAKKHDLVLIEDSAHCIEGQRGNVRPGQISDAACFSFYATKGMTSGEGGALTCKSYKEAEWYRSARHHGISKNASQRYTKKYKHWDMNFAGWKYNMDDIQAALLINQVDRLDLYRQKRQQHEMLYRKILGALEGLDFLELPSRGEISGHHLFTVLLPKNVSRDAFLNRMQKKGIGCAVNYRAVHTLNYFKKAFGYKPQDFPVANEIGRRTISLPLYPKLTEEKIQKICRIFKEMMYN